jgi:predicted metalloendopeptidase
MMQNHANTRRAAVMLGAAVLLGSGAGALQAQTPGALGVETRNFDRSVRPQDDFYRYANGTWLKTVQIPEDRSRYGAFDELREKSTEALHVLLEEAASSPARKAGSDLQKVGDYYLSYMDTARIEKLGLSPLRPELKRIAAVKNASELPELFAHLRRIGVGTPFSFGVGQDAKQADRYIASVSQGGLGLPDRDYYLQEGEKFKATREAYARYIETLFRLAGEKDPAGAAKGIVALETSLAKSHWDRARSRDREATYNLKTVAELGQLTPHFSWSRFLKAAGAEATPGVVVRQPDYLEALDRQLQEVPLAVWKQYLTFKVLDGYASNLNRAFADARFAFRGRVLQGLEEEGARWKRGVAVTEGALGEVLGRLYVERNFKPESRARMQQLVGNLLSAFRKGIDELEWMSPETKAEAQQKLAKFTVKIGYPDKWRDYSALVVKAGDLVGNEMRASEFSYQRMVGRLGQPVDRSEWGMTPQTVNAYYSSTMNEIVFPAAILQPPFFDPKSDDAVNYGAIGAVIGHEISHGFDDQGRRSDGDGNLRDWWTAADAKAFEAKTTMLGAQYDSFSPLPGMHVNGKLTMGENIGDLSGLAVAYKAYRIALGGKEAPVIEGFTGDQRFFLGWAQIWRGVSREEALRQQLLTDPHSPGEYRVNGVLRNLPEFYAAFGVKEGDGMYLAPEQRVKIW